MQMKITIFGAGIGIPKSGFSVNLATGAYIEVRQSKNTPAILFAIGQFATLGNEASTFLAGYVNTDWFDVNPAKHRWITKMQSMVGKEVELQITGALVFSGHVDISLTLIRKNKEGTELLKLYDIKAGGAQIASSAVRGKLLYHHVMYKKVS